MPQDERANLEKRVDQYVAVLFSPEDAALQRAVELAVDRGLPAIHVTPNEGRLLYVLARMIRPARILEIGSLTGYSTIWLARALEPGGVLLTVDSDPRCVTATKEVVEAAGLGSSVDVCLGDATQVLNEIREHGDPPFDLCFIDAEKTQYLDYLQGVLPLCRSGTVILSDNLIRNGAVLGPDSSKRDATFLAAFNKELSIHPRLESVIVPLINREALDGIGISVVR